MFDFLCFHRWEKIELDLREDAYCKIRRCEKCGAEQIHVSGIFAPKIGWVSIYNSENFRWDWEERNVIEKWEEYKQKEREAFREKEKSKRDVEIYEELEENIISEGF